MGLFGKKNKLAAQENLTSQTTIMQEGTEFIGNIQSSCSIRIDSVVHGSIVCDDRVIIGTKAFIKGSVNAKEIEVYGKVEGELDAPNISLQAGCQVHGDICCKHLMSEPEAIFRGKCEIEKKQEDPVKVEMKIVESAKEQALKGVKEELVSCPNVAHSDIQTNIKAIKYGHANRNKNYRRL